MPMLNKLLGQNVETPTVNPTRSVPVDKLIRDVRKVEVQRQGKSSCSRRLLQYDKFEKLVKIIRGNRDPLKQCSCIAPLVYSSIFQLGVDYTCALMINEIKSYSVFKEFVLRLRMCWSKNLAEERLGPSQIMLTSSKYNFCSHPSIVIFLSSIILW